MEILLHHKPRRTPAFILTSVFCLLTSFPLSAEKWQISYFYDKDKSSLVINDLQFPSATRGVAAGYLDDKGISKPVTVTTDDSGAHWTTSKLKEVPISLFFLNDKL